MQLKPNERDQIAILFASGVSFRLIARKLSRSVSSIHTEIKRNSINGEYQATRAQDLSQKRNNKSRICNPLKNPQIYSYVYDKLTGTP